jgi:hypothetical protein
MSAGNVINSKFGLNIANAGISLRRLSSRACGAEKKWRDVDLAALSLRSLQHDKSIVS